MVNDRNNGEKGRIIEVVQSRIAAKMKKMKETQGNGYKS